MSTRVLLVEDEIDARDTLARGLTRADFVCEVAGTVEEATSRAALGFDAAVVDIALGPRDQGGLELVPILRGLAPAAPVVVITAFADLAKVKRALNEGAAFLLEKPFTAKELVVVLRRVMEERGGLSVLVDRALATAHLTEKEGQIARLLLKGLPTAEIARLEGNSDKTVRQHVSQIYAKCGVATRAEFFHYVFPS